MEGVSPCSSALKAISLEMSLTEHTYIICLKKNSSYSIAINRRSSVITEYYSGAGKNKCRWYKYKITTTLQLHSMFLVIYHT